jgi:hypothetical protein
MQHASRCYCVFNGKVSVSLEGSMRLQGQARQKSRGISGTCRFAGKRQRTRWGFRTHCPAFIYMGLHSLRVRELLILIVQPQGQSDG